MQVRVPHAQILSPKSSKLAKNICSIFHFNNYTIMMAKLKNKSEAEVSILGKVTEIPKAAEFNNFCTRAAVLWIHQRHSEL